MVYAALFWNHTAAHVKPVEEHTRNPEGDLGKIQHDTRLVDKVDALGSSEPFLGGRYPVEYALRAENLIFRKRPLACACQRRMRSRLVG